MRVTLSCDSCVNILALGLGVMEAAGMATVEIDLSEYDEAPTPADIHAAMPEDVRTTVRNLAITHVKDFTHEEGTIDIICGHSDDWTPEIGRDLSDLNVYSLFEFMELTQDSREIHDLDAFFLWVGDYVNLSHESAHEIKTRWSDAFLGIYDSASDYAREIFEECNYDIQADTSNWPFCYIDWDNAAEHLELEGSIATLELDSGRVCIISPSV